MIKSRYAESRGSYEIFSRIAEGGLWEKRTNICHTPDERLLELKENVQNEDGGINMCGAVDQMIAEGMERGLAEGMERGIVQGTERGIKNLIEVCQELGTSYDNVQFQVEMKYNLSQEEAERYMKQYWK